MTAPSGLCRLHLRTARLVLRHAAGEAETVGGSACPNGDQPGILCKRRVRGHVGEKGLPVFHSLWISKPLAGGHALLQPV